MEILGYTYEDNLEEHFLVDLHELLIPLVDIGRLLAIIGLVLVRGRGVVTVVLTPLDNLAKDRLGHL